MAKAKKYRGTVNKYFKIKKTEYNVGDIFETKCQDTYNTLLTTKRIK